MSDPTEKQRSIATVGYNDMFGSDDETRGAEAEVFHYLAHEGSEDFESGLGDELDDECFADSNGVDGNDSDDEFLDAFYERLAAKHSEPEATASTSSKSLASSSSVDHGVSSASYSRQLQFAFFNLPGDQIKMPWETGPCQAIFGGSGSFQAPWGVRGTVPPIPEREVKHFPLTVDSAAFSRRVLRVRRLEVASETALRARAYERWLLIVKIMPEASDVGRMLLDSSKFLCSNDELSSSIKDVLTPKSTRTLLKRSADLTCYIMWCSQKSIPPFPVEEGILYGFLCESREKGCAATFPSSIRSAINFVGGMLGMDGALAAGSSKRIAGLVHGCFITKAPLRQMKPLTLDMIEFLERVVRGSGPTADRVFAGFCLMCVFCRLRFSDGQLISELSLDLVPGSSTGYLEGKQKPGKTSVTKEKKAALLPIAGPVRGITVGESWAVVYVSLLESEGILKESKITSDFLLMNPGPHGGWGKHKVCSTEATAWLRELLIQGGFSESETNDRATHSLKSTLLSWVAKFGVDRDSRKALGFHLNKADETMALYSRDMMAKPLRDLDAVLDSIRRKVFNPDLSRSGYFVTPGGSNSDPLLQPAAKRKVNPSSSSAGKAQEADDSSSSESSSSSEAPSEKDFDFDEKLAEVSAVPRRAAGSIGSVVVQHVRYGTLHLVSCLNEHKLACGHPHGDATWTSCGRYRVVQDDMRFNWPKCTACFGGQQSP